MADKTNDAGHGTRAAKDWLDRAHIAPGVAELRPDYTALLFVAEGPRPGPSDDASAALLAGAEVAARKALAGGVPEDLAPVAAWRLAYQAFGADTKLCSARRAAANPGLSGGGGL